MLAYAGKIAKMLCNFCDAMSAMQCRYAIYASRQVYAWLCGGPVGIIRAVAWVATKHHDSRLEPEPVGAHASICRHLLA